MNAIRNRRKLEKRITAIVDELVEAMDLGWLEVQLRFDEFGNREAPSVAKSACDWQYRRNVMTWTLPEASSLTNTELQLVAIHELCHSLIEPLWDAHPEREDRGVVNLGELVTESVARVVQFLLTEIQEASHLDD